MITSEGGYAPANTSNLGGPVSRPHRHDCIVRRYHDSVKNRVVAIRKAQKTVRDLEGGYLPITKPNRVVNHDGWKVIWGPEPEDEGALTPC